MSSERGEPRPADEKQIGEKKKKHHTHQKAHPLPSLYQDTQSHHTHNQKKPEKSATTSSQKRNLKFAYPQEKKNAHQTHTRLQLARTKTPRDSHCYNHPPPPSSPGLDKKTCVNRITTPIPPSNSLFPQSGVNPEM